MNDRFSDLADEAEPLAGAARDTFVPRPRAADTDRTPQSRADAVPDAGPVPDRARRAWDASGDPALAARSPSDIPQAADPVDVATGDVLLFQDDVSLPGLLPLVIGRAYRSSWRAGRWFGPSWASSLDQRLQIAPDRIAGVFADGRVLSWSCRAAEDGPVPLTGLPVTGPRWRLERTGGGAFMVTDPQAGLVWRFEGRGTELPLVSVTDRRGGQIRFGYTEQGEPAWITHSGGYRVRVVVSGGRVAELRLATPAGEETLTRYRYDPAGNLAGIVNGSGRALRLSYDAEGRLTGWQDRNGISYRYSYDEQGRCVAGAGPAGALSGRFAYGDRVTWWTDAAGAVIIYQLDASSRVTAVTDPLGHVTHVWYDEYGCVSDGGRISEVTGARWAERYRYDPAGNVVSAQWSAPPPVAASGWLSADLQGPRERTGTLITSAGTVRYRHDRQGRVIARHRTQLSHPPATWSYRWDADDRLTAVSTPDGSTWRYRYDPLGRRIAKQRFDPSGAPAEETTFTWDGAVLAEESAGAPELRPRRRLTWDYRPGTFTALTQSEHVSASDAPQQVIDEPFYAIIADQVGMPAELIAPDGTVAGYQQHTLWGGTLWRPGGAATPLRFPGQYHDPETGLHYNQQRYYDPVTGSYLTPDPLGLAPAPNPHAYVANPLIQTDPLGLMSCGPEGGARFITNVAGDTLDTSRITIPEGKFGYLLKNPSKAGVFSVSMGFDQPSLDAALRSHLTENFGKATERGVRVPRPPSFGACVPQPPNGRGRPAGHGCHDPRLPGHVCHNPQKGPRKGPRLPARARSYGSQGERSLDHQTVR